MLKAVSSLVLLLFTSALSLAEVQNSLSLSARADKAHREFLESRRALFPELSDPFQVASKAKVIDEEPEPWEDPETSPWRRQITATVFWVGEQPTARNPTPNHASSWDPNWQKNFGGVDRPELRKGYLPRDFIPKQSPFYIALPYNDRAAEGGYQPEAHKVIPWFYKAKKSTGQSVCNGRWVAIHREGKICYAQWRDCGPYRTDDWRYVFLGERPLPNPNGNAGIDVSPAVRDYLKLGGNYKVDWKFIEDYEVVDGPWKNWNPAAE